MRPTHFALAASALLALLPCPHIQAEWTCAATAGQPLLTQAESFLLAALALSPIEATQVGYHTHEGRSLDTELGSLSPAALNTGHALLVAGKACFTPARAAALGPEDRADLTLLIINIDQELFSFEQMHSERYRPEQPVEAIGSALFFPLTQQYGTEAERLAGVVARMEKVPQYLREAKANLVEADPIFLETAQDEAAGDKEVIASVGQSIPAASPLHARYQVAATKATAAVDDYAGWLTTVLAKRPHTRDWRSGPQNYRKLFDYAIGSETGATPATLLASAERDLAAVRQQMYAIALPLSEQWFPGYQPAADLSEQARQSAVITRVIDRINDDHTTAANLLPQVRSQLASIQQFIQEKQLLTVSSRDNLKVVETPPFLRQAYSVAGFHAPGPLDPGGEGEYWVTPISPDTPAAAAESKLREYNNWMLQYLTMHEALPGHYTQFEHANSVEPASRRILRALLGNTPYIEGWGEYGVKEMEDAGYANHDPRFVLMVLKIRLRVIANAILDIRMQSMNMTDEEAMALLEGQAFQTHAEAEGKLRRAKLTAGQLVTYYVGFHQWIEFRDRYQQAAGASFSLKQFNDSALDEGPLPLPVLEPLMMSRVAGKK